MQSNPAPPNGWKRLPGLALAPLQQVPFVAERVAKNRNRTIGFVPRFFQKNHPGSLHPGMIRCKIIGLQEQKHPAPGLFANRAGLIAPRSLGQQNPAFG